jgi:hypothetical protein
VKALPYDTKGIAEDFESNDKTVDVVVLEIPSRRATVRHHIHSMDELRSFFERSSIEDWALQKSSSAEKSFVFLVEDLSSSMIELLGGYLRVPPQVFIRHMSSGETIRHKPHDRSKPCPADCPGYRRRIQATQPLHSNDLRLHSCTWWRLSYYTREIHGMVRGLNSHRSEERVAWKNLGLPPLPANGGYHLPWRRVNERVCRPYHAITEVDDDEWGCAAEEQVTFFDCYPNYGLCSFRYARMSC